MYESPALAIGTVRSSHVTAVVLVMFFMIVHVFSCVYSDDSRMEVVHQHHCFINIEVERLLSCSICFLPVILRLIIWLGSASIFVNSEEFIKMFCKCLSTFTLQNVL